MKFFSVAVTTPNGPLWTSLVLLVSSRGWSETYNPLDTVVNRTGDFELGYKTTAQYMLGVFVDEPPTIHPITGLPANTASKRSGWLLFDRREYRD